MRFLLYSTVGCHLCDQAKVVVARVLADASYVIEDIDISADDALLSQYGVRIPVIALAASPKKELDWPFSEQQFRHWLGLLLPLDHT